MNTPNETQPGLYCGRLDEHGREAVRRTRTFAEIIQELGRDHEAHVARIDALLVQEQADV